MLRSFIRGDFAAFEALTVAHVQGSGEAYVRALTTPPAQAPADGVKAARG
ncbi:hypothetical protein [Pseudacidovorax intermedius]|nr:hypothetical protein [Pseudacidovorax intermedius]